jgi:hypothetical protein
MLPVSLILPTAGRPTSSGGATPKAAGPCSPTQESTKRGGIATDSFGRLYVANRDNDQVQVRDVNGKWRQLSDPGQHSELPSGTGLGPGGIRALDRP